MALDIQFPGGYDNPKAAFVAATGVLGRVLVPEYPATALAALTAATAAVAEIARPDESTIEQRVLTGGCRVIDVTAVSTDSTARDLRLYSGTVTAAVVPTFLPLGVSSMTTLVITTQNTFTRTGMGSFITDGWQVGQQAMLWGSAVAANNGAISTVTAVTATVLTFSGTVWTNEAAVQTGAEIYRVAPKFVVSIAINSGNTSAIANTKILNAGNDSVNDSSGLFLGANEALIGALLVATSGNIAVSATVGRL